jgi:hypothetical protein
MKSVNIGERSIGLGNRCSILLSYGAKGSFPRFPRFMGQPGTRKGRKGGLNMAAQEVAHFVREMF